jgi:DNA-binding GntR family transcriptional regulator
MLPCHIELPGKQSLAEELYGYLRGAILSGELHPYERLIESTLAELASVSRTPVREALHRLELSGLVREGERGGLEVRGFSVDEVADFCAVSEMLEGMATELAATLRSEWDVAALRMIVNAEARALEEDESTEIQVSLNHSFRETLWHASQNRYLIEELQRLREVVEGLRTTPPLAERQAEALDEHRAIVDAVERRDGKEASALARLHSRNALATRLVLGADSSTGASGRTAALLPNK